MVKRPPVWVSFKVSDIPDLPGTRIGDYVVENVLREGDQYTAVLVCSTCGRARLVNLYAVNRMIGRCKHN